jgi:putative membrane protein
MMGHGVFGIGYGGGFIMPLIMIVMWGLMIAMLIYVMRVFFGQPGTHRDGPVSVPSQPSSLEYLNLRYARGEISRDEYERIRNEIS